MESDDSRVIRTAAGVPGNALVGNLLGDFGLELAHLAAYIDPPLGMLVIYLSHCLDAFHKLGKLLELGPLVVGGGHWHIHINGFFNGRHESLPALLSLS